MRTTVVIIGAGHQGLAMSRRLADDLNLKVTTDILEHAAELELAFFNPEDRVREGRFRLTLPAEATVVRLAMRIAGRLEEGEVVERKAARAGVWVDGAYASDEEYGFLWTAASEPGRPHPRYRLP